MALALYTAGTDAQRIYDYPWADWTSLREAWEVAEHFKQTYNNAIKVYAALLIDTWAVGHLALGGRSAPGHLQIDARGKPINLPTRLWGDYGWATWCHLTEDAIKEAIASNSRGPVTEVADQKPYITWLMMELEIPLNKLPFLFKKGYITTGCERNGINSVRLHGDVPGDWISSVHRVIQKRMTHHTWAHIKLGAMYRQDEGTCSACSCEGATWGAYCAKCWVTYMSHKTSGLGVLRGEL